MRFVDNNKEEANLAYSLKMEIMKSKKNQVWVLSLCVTALFFAAPMKAQVTIGSDTIPNKDALLELKQDGTTTKGLLLPRVALKSTSLASPLSAHVPGMEVFNTDSINDVTPGTYYDDGTKWVKSGGTKWFYMPSFNLPAPTVVNAPTECDLYKEYLNQFTNGNGQFISSNASATNVQPVYAREQLDYFVSAYYGPISISSISPLGVMTYTFTDTNIPEGSFVNIIFVVK